MKKLLTIILTAFLMASCAFTERVSETKTMTLLVYIAGNNSLGMENAMTNIMAMKVALGNGMVDCNLLAYVDRKDTVETKPVLIHIHDSRIDTVKTYPRQSSLDTNTMKGVIDDVLTDWPSEYYGLLLWSHGMGWVPTDQLHFVAPNLSYAQTRAFGLEANPNSPPPYRCMEISEMAAAIPDGVFDYIVFDACYMGGVETAYALRKKANYIISSCCEVVEYGIPYEKVTRELLSGNLMNVCSQIFNNYYTQPGRLKSVDVALVKTCELENVASAFGNIVAGRRNGISKMDVSDIQRLDRFTNHVYYDLEDVARHITDDEELLADFSAKLEQCVPFRKSTDYIFYEEDSLKIDRYSGLSVFIPLEKYDACGLNAEYRKTEWSIATDY